MVLASIAKAIFGSANDRQVKKYQPKVDAINALEPAMAKLSDAELRAKTDEFRAELKAGKKLDDLLVPAFAVVREAGKRVLGMRHFDVQLIGGMVLNDRSIAEMRTGEGKTLVATLPVYLNALTGLGVHVVTVNDYLAKRDSEWMGQIYKFLGLTTGIIVHGLDDTQRKQSYAADVTYGTNNEYGFDYLRDNMKYSRDQMVQRGHAYAIVDEVDSILIDEARTPLIISGPTEDRSDLYMKVDEIMLQIGEGDFDHDEKQRSVTFTESGTEKLEGLLRDAGILKGESLYDLENVNIVHHANSALRAHKMFNKDKDYIVRNDEGGDHRRVHRPHDAGPPLLRGPAPGTGSQGTRQDPAGKPDAGLDHLPELLPPLQEAGRHDRYRGDGSRRVRQHLQPQRRHRAHQRQRGAQGRRRCDLPHRRGEVRRDHQCDPRRPEARPARAGRNDLDRKVRNAGRSAQAEGHRQHAGAERSLSRAGSARSSPMPASRAQ